LHRLRIDLDQREALGEILGGAYGTPAQQRTRIVIISRSPSTPPRSTSASPWVRPSAPRSSRPPESRALLVALRAR
jgi:hypothetical protein